MGHQQRAQIGDQPTVLAFLADPHSYPGSPARVEAIETHMSRVFLAGDRVYKLKKPINLSFVDFTTLESRRRNCERELALNQLLAPNIYLEVTALTRRLNGTLQFGGDGEPVEWLLVMRRLAAERLLHNAIRLRDVVPEDIDRVCGLLGSFYARAARVDCPRSDFLAQWQGLVELVQSSLADPAFALPASQVRKVLGSLRSFLDRDCSLLTSRLEAGRILDGHGDLRPEHIHLGPPVRIIDRLEFDERLRWADPFDETGFLSLECDMLGAEWIGPRLFACLSLQLDDRPPERLLRFYRCYRAALRARLTIEHLRDPNPRTPDRWPRLARRYLRMAIRSLPDQS